MASSSLLQRRRYRESLAAADRRLAALPLRVRLVALVVLLMLVALSLTSGLTSIFLRSELMDRTNRELRAVATPIAQLALQQLVPNSTGSQIPTNYAVRFMPAHGGTPTYVSTSATESVHPAIPVLALDDPRVLTSRPFTVGSSDGEGSWQVVAGRVGDDATFAVAVSLNGVDQTVSRLRTLALVIALLVTLVVAVIAWYAVRRTFRPLTEIEDTAAAIAAGDLTRRIPMGTADDEVTSLARSLNVMLAQIESSFAVREASEQRMRQFVADASHELRTPLAAVRGYAELFRQGAVASPEDVAGAMRRIEDEASRMGVLVEDLLLLARLDNERPMRFEEVDLTVLAADAAQDARAIAPDRAIRVVGLGGELGPVLVQGDESRLRQVLSNLMGNAVHHTPAGTPVEIAVGRNPAGQAEIQVRDHGEGLPEDQAGRVFERFYRGDPSRGRSGAGGNGLGLAIVAAIVAGHDGGKVGVAPTPGGGATFVVTLPTAVPQPVPSQL